MNENEFIKTYCADNWEDYELLDTGEGEKLERFGKFIFARPLDEAVWKKTMRPEEWREITGKFLSSKEGNKKGWKLAKNIPQKWEMEYKGIKFLASPTPFRHLGFFPEQAVHWEIIERELSLATADMGRPVKVLNLFGYTGVASLFALRANAEVTHVDASPKILAWAKENQKISGLEKSPMRIIEEDAVKFLRREKKRGNKYDCVIMDPPKFGRGPKGEVWEIKEMLPELLSLSREVLSEKPVLVILTAYSTDASALTWGAALRETLASYGGKTEQGELCVREKATGRLISLAKTAIWKRA